MSETEWKPIETAPKDGRPILITRPTQFPSEEGWHVVRWEDDNDWWVCHDGKFDTPLRGDDPTHWQPLPNLPTPSPPIGGGRMCAKAVEAAKRIGIALSERAASKALRATVWREMESFRKPLKVPEILNNLSPSTHRNAIK